ncbi:ComEC/Rec2 family competence protein [Chakrabartyella piscis]|uniref:ComEC/Rec2 family competence protein n=1 Tax=Chakrabartyella piscis TaxID=2918914 RepID=UPI002958BF96|nr:ComEC/Rec2 family competence protein [Chakrabartyella piscis]
MAKRRRTKKQKAFTKKITSFIIALLLIGFGRLTAAEDFSLDSLLAQFSTTTATSTASTIAASDDLRIVFLDVGQADSTLIQAAGKNMLIDAGNNEDGDLVVSTLQAYGVETLDFVIPTHPHEDHVGGMDDVIDAFDIGTVLLPNATSTTQTYEDMLDSIANKGLTATEPIVGDTYTLGDCTFTILGPVWDYGDDMNNWSVSIQLIHGENSFVFTGDAEAEAESDMLGTGLDLHGDVFQAGHHGSTTSNTEDFLNAVNPKYVVISCGANNSYSHPHEEILERFAERNITVYRTDTNGTIVATCDGTNISWETEY